MLTVIFKLFLFAAFVAFVCYWIAYASYIGAQKSLASKTFADYFRANGSKLKQIMELGIMNQNLVTGFFVTGVCVFAAQILGYLSPQIATALYGLLGFGGVAGMRAFIDSQGWKTHFVAVVGCAGVLALAFGFVDVAQLSEWLAGWGIVAAAAINHAIQKARAA